ncbi:hypothetical protein M3Y99_00490600 [Aphelenchoides fujianensis]|nr:hypothetical protein M3Y99_00490600 [Aphelenchoides fujianensis]
MRGELEKTIFPCTPYGCLVPRSEGHWRSQLREGEERGRDRALEDRRLARRRPLHVASRDDDHLPLAHHRPQAPLPAGGHPRRCHRADGDGQGRLDQAGRRRHRLRHQRPRAARRKAEALRRRGLRGGEQSGRLHHARARRSGADDRRDARPQHLPASGQPSTQTGQQEMLFNINRFHAVVLFTWQFAMFFASQMIFPIFSNYVPKWRCSPNELFSKNCTAFEACRSTVQFEYEYFHSSALEYDWICGSRSYFASLYSQIQFGGVLLGTIFFGSLSDCFGRKPISIVAISSGLTSTVLSGLAPTWYLLLASRFFIGLSIGGIIVVQRMALRAFFNWGTARLMVTAVCWFFPHWRHASIACAVVASPMLLSVIFVFPESPTWLHNKGRLQDMRKSEQKAARFAGVKYVEKEPEPIVRKKTLLDLLRDGTLVKRIFVLSFMWFTAATCGYATDLNSSNISGHLFLNQVLFSVLIAVSKFFLVGFDSYYTQFSRRNLHQYSQFISVWILVANLAGTIFIEYTWDACYLCAVEAMPTDMRATSMGTCSLIARLGAICAPTLTFLSHVWAPSPYLAVVVLGAINLAVSYAWLIETKGVNLDKVKLEGAETEEETKIRAPPAAPEVAITANKEA